MNSVNGLRVTKIVRGIKFEGVWVEFKSKNCFQRQSFTKYLRLALVSCEIAHYEKSLISVFQEFFASISKIFTLTRRLATRLSLYEGLGLS